MLSLAANITAWCGKGTVIKSSHTVNRQEIEHEPNLF